MVLFIQFESYLLAISDIVFFTPVSLNFHGSVWALEYLVVLCQLQNEFGALCAFNFAPTWFQRSEFSEAVQKFPPNRR